MARRRRVRLPGRTRNGAKEREGGMKTTADRFVSDGDTAVSRVAYRKFQRRAVVAAASRRLAIQFPDNDG